MIGLKIQHPHNEFFSRAGKINLQSNEPIDRFRLTMADIINSRRKLLDFVRQNEKLRAEVTRQELKINKLDKKRVLM